MSFGLGTPDFSPKRHNRWLFSIPGVVAVKNSVASLPPKRGARPGVNLKEVDCQHISEVIYYPMKADWKPIQLLLYDIRCNQNAVFDWLKTIYDPTTGAFKKVTAGQNINDSLLRDATLELYDGCGNVIEKWTIQKCYPQVIDWGELNMDSSDIVVADVTLRYQRAFFVKV